MSEWLIWPGWVSFGLGLAGTAFALGGFARARRVGWRSRADRTNAMWLLLFSVAMIVVGALRWVGG